MSLETKYYQFIVKVAKSFDKTNGLDLAHDVCIKLIEDKETVEQIEVKGNIKAYIYTLVRNEFLNNKKRDLYVELIDYDLANEDSIDFVHELNELIKEKDLTHIDRLWIDAFVERDLNASWLQSDLKIGRHCAKRRLNHIIDKLK